MQSATTVSRRITNSLVTLIAALGVSSCTALQTQLESFQTMLEESPFLQASEEDAVDLTRGGEEVPVAQASVATSGEVAPSVLQGDAATLGLPQLNLPQPGAAQPGLPQLNSSQQALLEWFRQNPEQARAYLEQRAAERAASTSPQAPATPAPGK